MFARRTAWIDVLRQVKEDGSKAARDGKSAIDNPYSFITETDRAFAWDNGFKESAAR